jgi:hypothetical protein
VRPRHGELAGEPGLCLSSCQSGTNSMQPAAPLHLLRRICQVCRAAAQRLARLHCQRILDQVASSLQVHHCRQESERSKEAGFRLKAQCSAGLKQSHQSTSKQGKN